MRGLQIPLTTITLLTVVAVGFGFVGTTPQQLVAAGASYGPRTLDGEWWRFITAAVVHAGWAHLIVNAITIAVMGVALERRVGRVATVVVFVGSSVVGTAAGTVSAPYAVIAGASSGALGMAGALVVVMAVGAVKRGPQRMEIVLLGVALAVIVAHVAMGRGREDIDQVGHVAGVIAGIGMGAVIARAATAAAAAAAAAAVIVVMGGPAPYEPRLATKRLIVIEERFDQIVDGPREKIADDLARDVIAPLEAIAGDARLDDRRMNDRLRARVARLKAYASARAGVVRQFADAVRRDDVAPLAAIEKASRDADAILDGPLP